MSETLVDFEEFLLGVRRGEIKTAERIAGKNGRRDGSNKAAAKQSGNYNSIPKSTRNATNRIHAAVGTKKQAMFKVVGAGGSKSGSNRKGMASASRLARYLSERADETLDLESRDGYRINGEEQRNDYLRSEWEPDFTTRKNGSDMVHVVVSTPEGSDRDKTLEAARAFGKEFFENHDYLLAAHNDTSNPHVHFMVKVKGDDGARLRLRKADIELARETFAHHARQKGIEVAASRRSTRGVGKTFQRKTKNGSENIKTEEYYRTEKKSEKSRDWEVSRTIKTKEEIYEYEKLLKTFERKGDPASDKIRRAINKHIKKLTNKTIMSEKEFEQLSKELKMNNPVLHKKLETTIKQHYPTALTGETTPERD